jgi:hypothetical protein
VVEVIFKKGLFDAQKGKEVLWLHTRVTLTSQLHHSYTTVTNRAEKAAFRSINVAFRAEKAVLRAERAIFRAGKLFCV